MNLRQFSFIFYISKVLFLFVTEINSQAVFSNNSENPDRPGFCHFTDPFTPEGQKVEMYLKPGQKRKHPTQCFRIDCSEDLSLTVLGCGVGASQNHCRWIEGDKSRPYPDCCLELIC